LCLQLITKDSAWDLFSNGLNKDEQVLIMGVAHKQHDVTGLFFHPESIMTEFGKEIIANWLEKS